MTASVPPPHDPPPSDPVAVPPRPKKQRRPIRPWQWMLLGAAIPVILLLALVLILPLVMNALMGGGPGSGPGETEYRVERVTLAQGVTLPGTIEPTQRLDLSFASPGEVTLVAVTVGDTVTPGTVLATIDDTDLRAAVTDARAETDAAWKDYQDARRSGQSAAISAMRSAHAVKAQALKDAEQALEKAKLTSTIDGVVAAVNVQRGQLAGEPGASLGQDPGAADVVVISRAFQVKASVGGAERTRLAKGMEAVVTSSSAKEPLRGTVTALGVVAEATAEEGKPSAASFPLVVTLEGQPTDVFAGSPATIEVLADAGAEPALAIPVEALMMRDSETKGMVLVRRGTEPTPTDVTLGSESNGMIEVTAGLNEGDVVVFFPMTGGPGGAVGPGVVAAQPAEEPKR